MGSHVLDKDPWEAKVPSLHEKMEVSVDLICHLLAVQNLSGAINAQRKSLYPTVARVTRISKDFPRDSRCL